MPVPGLVLAGRVPGPWGGRGEKPNAGEPGEIPPGETSGDGGEQRPCCFYAWTGVRNAPVAVLGWRAAADQWLEILLLAQPWARVLPCCLMTRFERALVLGFSTEICGPQMALAGRGAWELMGRSSTRRPAVFRALSICPE